MEGGRNLSEGIAEDARLRTLDELLQPLEGEMDIHLLTEKELQALANSKRNPPRHPSLTEALSHFRNLIEKARD